MSWQVTLAEAGGAAIVAAGAVFGGLSRVYRRGASEQKLTSVVEENTRATTKLTATFENFSLRTDGTLTDHEKRITRSEDRIERVESDLADIRKPRMIS